VVVELQKMPEGVEIKPKISKGGKGSRSKKGKDSESARHTCGIRQALLTSQEMSCAPSEMEEELIEVKPTTSRPRRKVAEVKQEVSD
jgi:hypothetical protein